MWNKILDASIYYSFDLSGFLRHSKGFDESIVFPKQTKCIITGGTSGIGHAAAKFMAKQNVQVVITGRDECKGTQAAAPFNNITFEKCDLANWDEVRKIVTNLEPLDYVVLNAGGMPDKFQTNKESIELQFASQLFGHYYLIKELKEQNKLNQNCRIVWVSSGGMYLKKLDLSPIFEDKEYNKVSTYANVKRAQVALLPRIQAEFQDYKIFAMHPGWVETPGVTSAIPDFARTMKGRLRSPLQGADTILWLLATQKKIESGKLYFDRRKVKDHLFFFTRSSNKKINELWTVLSKYRNNK